MKDLHPVVAKWFSCWETGAINELPVTENFSHTSPFGTITPKSRYIEIVEKNKKEFLENKLTVTKQIKEGQNVCVQFEQKNTATGLEMTVCEWYVIEDNLIKEIRSFYNVGDATITG